MMAVATGFLLGVATSAHCAVMCGPLMVVIRQAASGRTWAGALVYHLGRVLAYALGGAIVGTIGGEVWAGGFGQMMSVTSGLLLLAAAAARTPLARSTSAGRVSVWMGHVWARARRASAAWGRRGLFLAGAANAFLPCGVLWAALIAAGALGRPVESAVAMAAFGLGTVPAVAVVWWSIGAVRWWRPTMVAGLTPAMLVITGVLLIARGLGPASHAHAPATPQAAVAVDQAGEAHLHSTPSP